MPQIKLFDGWVGYRGYVEFGDPAGTEINYCCQPEGLVSPEHVKQIANELAQGAVCGWIQGMHWYRQTIAKEQDHDQIA
jgi:hypothetical protein